MYARVFLAGWLSLAACKSGAKSPPPATEGPAANATDPTRATELAPSLAKSIDPPAAPGALAPNLREGGDGGDDVLATWIEPAAEGAHRLRFSRWAKGAWSAPRTIFESPRLVANWADVPAIARAGDGALVVSWAEASGGAAHGYDAIVARSLDGGATWRRIGALHDDGTPTEHGFVSLLGEADAVRAFWLDGRATMAADGATTLRTATVAERVARSELLDDRVCDCCSTSAAATADGALVAYRDRGGEEVRDIAVARRTTTAPTAAWSSPAPVHRDGWQIAGCPVNGPALAARGARVAIAWYTYAESTHRVRAAFSEDGGASFGAPIEIDTTRAGRAPLGRVSLALADDGSAVVGYLVSEKNAAQILLRRVAREGALGPARRLGDHLTSRDAGVPRLARSGDSLVVIWTEPGPPTRLRAAEVALADLPLSATPHPSPSPPGSDRGRR